MKALHATFLSMVKEPVKAWLDASIMGRAQQSKIIEVEILSILDNVKNHHEVDDTPYGGGPGELMRIDVIAPLIRQALARRPEVMRAQKRVLLMDPGGTPFNQAHAKRLSSFDELIFVCGRFEGIDARVHHYVDEVFSLGDFVISCGELAALTIFDATARLLMGFLGNAQSIQHESHIAGRLESSHYTRPLEYEGLKVPSVLHSGHHKNIAECRQLESVIKTQKLRPDLLEHYPLSQEEKSLLSQADRALIYPWQKNYE